MMGWLFTLPGGALGLLLTGFCLWHIISRRREFYWLWVILLFPFMGALVYLIVEVWPEWRGRHAGRRLPRGGARRVRALELETALLDTVENRLKLAEAYKETGADAKAIAQYEACLKGLHKDDPHILTALADLRVKGREYDGALAALAMAKTSGSRDCWKERAYLEGLAKEGKGDWAGAEASYRTVENALPGEEVRCRLALLLEKQGRREEALSLCRQVLAQAARSDRAWRRREKTWIDTAAAAERRLDRPAAQA